MKRSTAIVLACVALGLGLVVGAYAFDRDNSPAVDSEALLGVDSDSPTSASGASTIDPAHGTNTRANDRSSAADAALVQARNERDAARAEANQFKKQAAELQSKLDEANANLESIGWVPLDQIALAVKFGSPEAVQALAGLKWDELGTAAHDMRTGLSQFMAEIQQGVKDGKQIDMSRMGEIMKPGMKLVPLYSVLNGKVESTSEVAGSATHPLVLFNLMASELAAAGHPLSATQQAAFNALGIEYEGSWRRLQEGYNAETFLLQRMVDEVELKQAILDKAFANLDASQTSTVRDAAYKGVIGMDSYNPGMIFAESMGPLMAMEEDQLVPSMMEALATKYGIEKSRLEAGDYIFKEWIAELKGHGVLDMSDDNPWEQFMPKVVPLVACAKAQLSRTHALIGVIRPDEVELKRIRECGTFLNPRLMKQGTGNGIGG